MATGLKPYKDYKPIAYDYVSRLPEGWKLLPNIALFEERIERGFDKEELLSVTIKRGVIKQTELDIKKDSSNEDKSKYKLVKPGDIAYNKMRMWQGAVGYSNYRGIVSPAYVILKPKVPLNNRYYHYMLRSGFYTNYCKRFSYGIVDDQLSLRYTDFKRMYSIVPPLAMQNAIVDYLDEKCAEIDRFIRNKERYIGLLDEQLNSNTVALINEGEELIKLKYLLKIQNGDGLASDEVKDDGDFEVYGGNGVLGFHNRYNCANETLIIGRVGALCGNVHYTAKKIWVSDNAMYVKTKLPYKYIYYLLRSQNLNKLSFANAQPLITGTLVKNLSVKFFRNTDDQMRVVNHIEEFEATTNDLKEKATTEINAIKEFKEALITQLITGALSPFATN